MTTKEAVIKSLEELVQPSNYSEIYKHILDNKYYDFENSKTPSSTISAVSGDFIRNGDNRVSRIKTASGVYKYYTTKSKENIDWKAFDTKEEKSAQAETDITKKNKKQDNSFQERDLHKLLSTFLNNTNIFAKTIFHEESNTKEKGQIWTHPDMIGIKLLNLKNETSQKLMKSLDKNSFFELSSYELKRGIYSDTELKESFFQAVSNSSWAHYGYLVTFEFNSQLDDEMKRLNQSFGIGLILLNANPFKSKVLYEASLKHLDFSMIDKLSQINKSFEMMMRQIEKLLNAQEAYIQATINELKNNCDEYLENDTAVSEYCKNKNIPLDEEDK